MGLTYNNKRQRIIKGNPREKLFISINWNTTTLAYWWKQNSGSTRLLCNQWNLLNIHRHTIKLQLNVGPLSNKSNIKHISNSLILWGCASKSNTAIMQRYQSKILRAITNAPWYVNNQTLHTVLQIPFVHTVFQDHICKDRNTLESHPSPLVKPILHSEHNRRLKWRWTFDATNWGNVDGRSPRSLTQLPEH